MKKDTINITIPSKPDYISVVRLTSSAIASNMGLNIEEIEDIKVSIAEACINAIDKSNQINVQFEIEKDKLIMKVDNVYQAKDDDTNQNKELELGILIIKSLMDKVNFSEKGVEMIKYIEDGNK